LELENASVENFTDFHFFLEGYDVRPTIAVTKAHIDLPEFQEAIRVGRLVPDGTILKQSGTFCR